MDQTIPSGMPEPIKASASPVHFPFSEVRQEEEAVRMEIDPNWPEVEELETDLFATFKHLPAQEQDTIINSLKQLVYNLRKLKFQKTLGRRTELDLNLPNPFWEPHEYSLENNHPLEPTVIVKKKNTNTNLIVSSENPIFNLITAD